MLNINRDDAQASDWTHSQLVSNTRKTPVVDGVSRKNGLSIHWSIVFYKR